MNLRTERQVVRLGTTTRHGHVALHGVPPEPQSTEGVTVTGVKSVAQPMLTKRGRLHPRCRDGGWLVSPVEGGGLRAESQHGFLSTPARRLSRGAEGRAGAAGGEHTSPGSGSRRLLRVCLEEGCIGRQRGPCRRDLHAPRVRSELLPGFQSVTSAEDGKTQAPFVPLTPRPYANWQASGVAEGETQEEARTPPTHTDTHTCAPPTAGSGLVETQVGSCELCMFKRGGWQAVCVR